MARFAIDARSPALRATVIVLVASAVSLMASPARAEEAPPPPGLHRPPAPGLERIETQPAPGFSIDLVLRRTLPVGTRIDAALVFAGATVPRTWKKLIVTDSGAEIRFDTTKDARDGVYTVLVAFDPDRQPLARQGDYGSVVAARWRYTVYVGTPADEIADLEDERTRLRAILDGLALLADDLEAFDAARKAAEDGGEGGAVGPTEKALGVALDEIQAHLAPLRPEKLLAPFFADAVDDVITLVDLVGRAVGSDDAGPARRAYTPSEVATEIRRRVELHAGTGLVAGPEAARADAERTIETAVAFVRQEAAITTGVIARLDADETVEAGATGKALERLELLAADLRGRIERLESGTIPGGAEMRAALVRLGEVHELVTRAHGAAVRERLDLEDVGGGLPSDQRTALEAERDELVAKLLDVLTERDRALGRLVRDELKLLRKLRATWERLDAGGATTQRQLGLWRTAAELQLEKRAAKADDESDPLVRAGVARRVRLHLQMLLSVDQIVRDRREGRPPYHGHEARVGHARRTLDRVEATLDALTRR